MPGQSRLEQLVHNGRAGLNHGLSWCRYTNSVTVVPLCPTSREICSSGTPASESTETNECRSSRGVHSSGSMPGTRWSARRKVTPDVGASAVPNAVVKTSPVSCQRSPGMEIVLARADRDAAVAAEGWTSFLIDQPVWRSSQQLTARAANTMVGWASIESRCGGRSAGQQVGLGHRKLCSICQGWW